MDRRTLLIGAACLGAAPTRAQASWPTRTIRMVVPFIPGSAPDVIARTLGERVGTVLSQTIVIDNRAGAGGNIGFEAAAKAAPDGYTFLLGTSSLSINASLYARVPFDPLRDFAPVNLTIAMPHLLVVPSGSRFRTAGDLVAAMRADSQITYASGGNGSGAHLAAEMLKTRAGVSAVHVPYRGAPQIVAAVIAGEVAFGLPTMSTAVPLVQGGHLRALAVTSPERSVLFPDVPALREVVPGAELVSWFGVLAPAGTPEAAIAGMDRAIGIALADPAFRAKVTADGSVILGLGAAAFAAMLPGDMRDMAAVVRASGARVD